jgi:MFS family permease
MFTLSVLLMAIPTLLIGVLPTYQSIGIGAPLLLLLMRITQGTAMGGEAPGGWVFGAEHARHGRVGLAVGLLTSGLSLGILLGSVVATSVNVAFSPMRIAGGIWRMPFLIGGIFGLTAMYLRRWLDETPVFEEMRSRAALSRELPLRAVVRRHGGAVAVSMISTCSLMGTIVVVILMSPALLHQWFGLSLRDVQVANLAGSIGLCLSTVAIGAVVDRFGLRRATLPAFLLLIAGTYGLYLAAGYAPSFITPLYFVAGCGAGASVLTPILMVQVFPPEVRFTGVSFSYNVACAAFGGITPLLVSWLAHLDRFSPAHYIAALGVVGVMTILMSRRTAAMQRELVSDAAA